MGLLDSVMDGAKRTLGSSGQSGLLDGVMEMLSDKQAGGLSGLVEQFKGKGLGDIVSSWVSTGQNLPVSAEQIQQVLGGDKLQQLAQHAGIKPDAVANSLANLLPSVVDKLTPDGKVPEGGLLEQGMDLLKGKLFG